MIEVTVKGVFGDIGVDLYLVVFITLSDDTALSLLEVGGTPGAVQVVQGNQFLLDIGAGAHLLCGTEQDPDLSAAYLAEQFFFLGFRIG